MPSTTIEDRMKTIVADELGVDESEITANASLLQDLGADSLDHVELIMRFEDEYDIQIDDEAADKVETFGQAVELVDRLIAGKVQA